MFAQNRWVCIDTIAVKITDYLIPHTSDMCAKPLSYTPAEQSKELQHPHPHVGAQYLCTALPNRAARALQ